MTSSSQAPPRPVQRGQTLTYAFTLTNPATTRATGSTLLVVLSSHLLVTAVTPSQGSCIPAHVLVCRLGTVPVGSQATVTLKAKVKSTAPATLYNTATAQANERDPRQGNNQLVTATPVRSSAPGK